MDQRQARKRQLTCGQTLHYQCTKTRCITSALHTPKVHTQRLSRCTDRCVVPELWVQRSGGRLMAERTAWESLPRVETPEENFRREFRLATVATDTYMSFNNVRNIYLSHYYSMVDVVLMKSLQSDSDKTSDHHENPQETALPRRLHSAGVKSPPAQSPVLSEFCTQSHNPLFW